MGVVTMFKKVVVGFMITFICSIQIGCCYSINTKNKKRDYQTRYLDHQLKNIKNSPLHNQNFVFLTKHVMTKYHKDNNEICYKDTKNKHDCLPHTPISSASGYIVKVDVKINSLYAITAAHWCEPIEKEELNDIADLILDKKPVIGSFINFMGHEYRINKIKKVDYRNDLCLIEFKSNYARFAKTIEIAKKDPIIGESVYTIAAPLWSHENEIRQHYTGKFSGCNESSCSFTIPSTYGSSGSAIINEKGEIVSIVTRAAIDFNHYTIGPKKESLKIFLEKNL
jgi:S1-C subfamily serine protease